MRRSILPRSGPRHPSSIRSDLPSKIRAALRAIVILIRTWLRAVIAPDAFFLIQAGQESDGIARKPFVLLYSRREQDDQLCPKNPGRFSVFRVFDRELGTQTSLNFYRVDYETAAVALHDAFCNESLEALADFRPRALHQVRDVLTA